MNNTSSLEEWRDGLLSQVSNNTCRPCNSHHKKQFEINYIKPLNCKCSCIKVVHRLQAAWNLDNTLNQY